MNRWILPRRFRARYSGPALIILGLYAFVFWGITAPSVRADDAANEAARELGRKLATQLDLTQRHLLVSFKDATTELSFKETLEVMQAFEKTVLPPGYRPPRTDTPSMTVQVTLSKNFAQRLLVAQFEKDGRPIVEIVTFALEGSNSGGEIASSVRVETQIVFAQKAPLLDFALLKGQGDFPSQILALGIRNVVLMNQVNGRWQAEGTLAIPESAPVSRDPRGRLVVTGDTFEVGYGGTFCSGSVSPQFKINCDANAGRWSFNLPGGKTLVQIPVPGSNLFQTEGESPSTPRAVFSETTGWIGAMYFRVTVDAEGRTWLATGDDRPAAVSSAWGDEFAADDYCGARIAALAEGRGDFNSPDFLQAVGGFDGKINEASPAFNLPGPVMALWTESASSPIRAVVHNLKTGMYEAHQITLSCGH